MDSVYSEENFSIDTRVVEDLLRIHDHLENPDKAVELLIELEGSFVRDEYQVNVLPAEYLDKFVGRNERELGRLVSMFCVPVSARMLKALKVIGFLYVDEEGKVAFEEREVLPNPKDLLRGILLKRHLSYIVENDHSLNKLVIEIL